MSSDGLATLEPLTARVAGWRRRHRAAASDVRTYQVVFDGAIVATLEARTSSALDDEIATAAWELAQGLSRPATVDLVALDSAGDELARLPLRILPQAAPSDSHSRMVQDLLAQNRETMKLCVEMVSAVTAQMKVVADVTTELARAMGARALRAEEDATAATATVQEALAVARDAGAGSPKVDRAMDLVEDFLRAKLAVPTAANGSSA